MTRPALCALTIVWTAAGAHAQVPNASPQFEVASIKPSPPPDGGRMRVGSRGGPGTADPGMFTCERCPLTGLVSQAFYLDGYQLTAPDWMQSARFNVSAKIPEGATKEQFRQMLQNLLADRFKLKFHFEKKDVPAYNLVLAKNGPKMQESPTGPAATDAKRSSPQDADPQKRDADGFTILPPGRAPMMTMMAGPQGARATMRDADETMERFAGQLAGQLTQPVTDATGLKGKYDFTLRWVPDGGIPATDAPGPNLFQALQEQLGLKLEPAKATVDILVVDHMEKTPTEN